MTVIQISRNALLTLAILFTLAAFLPIPVAAAPPPRPAQLGPSIQIPGLNSRNDSMPWTVIVLFTVLTLLPALLLSMTPFVRILIVFHFLRQALGTQTAPTNQTLIGLALFLTYFVMQPVGVSIDRVSIEPFTK